MNKKELLLNAIEEMLSGKLNESRGICENLDNLTDQCWFGYDVVEEFSQTWSNFSGNKQYPISGREDWSRFLKTSSLWLGEQRELRMSLLEHIKSEVLKLSDEEFEEMF